MQIAPGTLQVRLSWQDPVTSEETVRLAPLPITLGRSRENTITLNSDAISRQHAALEAVDGEVVIADRGSKNGVYVNRARVQRVPLKDGDTFQIGPFRFTIEFDLSLHAPGQEPSASASLDFATVPMPEPQTPSGTVGVSSQEKAYISVQWTDPASGAQREITAKPPITIGRNRDNMVVLSGTRASRHHAILTLEGGQIIVTDQGTSNGTLLNGQRIQRAVVQPTDTIEMSGYRLTAKAVEVSASGAQPLAAAQPAPAPASGGWEPVRPTEMISAEPAQAGLLKLEPRQPDAPQLTPPPPLSPAIQALSQRQRSPQESTLIFSHESGLLLPFVPQPEAEKKEEAFPPPIFQQLVIPLWQLQQSKIAILETTYLAIGGGLGSFTWVDHLMIAGVPEQQIVVFALEPKPHSRYERLCNYSQIPSHERLRSNSDACPDNIWGWPSYGLREIFRDLGKGKIGSAIKVGAQVFGEPVLTDTYTPRSSDVFNGIDREAQRIGWGRVSRYGLARAIRMTDDGRYVVAVTQINQRQEMTKLFVIARYVHIAVGYPGIQFLADLQEYRDRTKDFYAVVNAYEDHHQVYEHLAKRGGVVMVRGRGIVASRVLQRLSEARQQNRNITILHVIRTPVLAGHRDGHTRRKVENHTEMQPFNWPKACAGGVLRRRLEKADDHTRDRLLNDWGGTTTAKRKDWRQIIRTGQREGWYQLRFARVKRVDRNQTGQLFTLLATDDRNQPETWTPVDFIIDCTGLEATLDSNMLLKDMVESYQLGRNPKGRLRVANDFELTGMRNGPGRIYASGAMTLGGPFAMADSFIGLQFAALRSVEALKKGGAPGLRGLGPLRSFAQWTRWVRGKHP